MIGSASLTHLPTKCGSVCGVGIADDAAAEVDRLAEEQSDLAAEQVVVLAEGRRDVNDAGAALHFDEVGGGHLTQWQGSVRGQALDQAGAVEAVGRDAPAVGVVEAVVGDVDQVRTWHRGHDCPVLDHAVEGRADELLRENEALVRAKSRRRRKSRRR